MTADPDRLELEALVARMAQADFGAGDPAAVRALEKHLAANPGKAELHGELAALWDTLGELEEPRLEPDEPAAPSWWQRIPYHKIAAALIPCLMALGLLLAVGGLGIGKEEADEPPFSLRTAAGERRIISLPDGSAVTLSARSAITIDFSATERRLNLIEGEAIFDVEHDPARPFVVEAGGGEVTAIGTTFNIRVAEEGAVVTVIEGRVNVSAGVRRGEARRQLDQVAEAGEQIVFGSRQVARAVKVEQSFITPAKPVDAPRVSEWSRGLLRFNGEPLSQVVAEVNRHSLRQIRIRDPELARTPIYGVLHIGDERGLLSIIQDLGGLSDAALTQKVSVEAPAAEEAGDGDR